MRGYDRHKQIVPGVEFSGPKFFLSNFYPCRVVLDGIEYSSSEHAFQAAKCLDPADANLVRMQPDALGAKRIARAVQRIRPDWDVVRIDVMRQVLHAKFTNNPDLVERLLATGDEELVERNTWKDRFWGEWNGKGENHLGKLLMELRAEIRSRRDAATPWIE